MTEEIKVKVLKQFADYDSFSMLRWDIIYHVYQSNDGFTVDDAIRYVYKTYSNSYIKNLYHALDKECKYYIHANNEAKKRQRL